MEDKFSGVWRSLRDGDFDEEDIWSVFKDKTTINDHSKLGISSSSKSKPISTAAPRMIPRSANSSHEANSSSKIVHQSAPMNIPNWPTSIFRHNNSATNKSFNDHDSDDDDDDEDDDGIDDDDDDDDDGFLVDDLDDKLPPHEFIARRLAKTQISSFSVFEGIGRTLKGRDLSKVRNAVLTKTGFLESL